MRRIFEGLVVAIAMSFVGMILVIGAVPIGILSALQGPPAVRRVRGTESVFSAADAP